MATLSIDDQGLHVHLTRFEHMSGFLPDLDAPLSSIGAVHSVIDPLGATRGLRVGLGMPGVIKVGRWLGSEGKQFVVARRGEPGLVIELDAAATGWSEAVLSADNVDELLRALDARRLD